MSEKGKVLTYLVVKAKPQGYNSLLDYTVAIARTEDVDLMCWLLGDPKVEA
ncbi:hypothetical protein HS1genome_2058 [Sulfodiicoccus acidiphilus]|uniref:ChsH2 C-terminal OB-fold domain-containing protein n=1 Tax=Sulfodiicoccus acidiphilus TaxID=1670455 RepID=A0A348B667_9CREN|nr:OB-fold domain-containing protein [Sulfodiicoccus acidiphilus]BBD73669.1 hypothetical protein HS1genome_2058 [Sulfodiicoccus acidiphilus]GGU01943.1 hypothetical protein GCM10007116_18800 [Sulfodiicoccus acidiphilus]